MENNIPANVDIAAPTATTPKLHPSVEETAMRKYIRDACNFLEEARLHPAITEGLEAYGYDDEELARGMALQEAASHAFSAIHVAELPGGAALLASLDSKVKDAREEFADFRLVARASFTGLDARLELRVMGDVPDDLQRFINTAHAGYCAAGEDPYTDKLSKRGYPPAKLSELGEALDTLATLDAAHDAAEDASETGGEIPDTEDRDRTYIELKEYMKEIKGVARAAFRKQPEIMEKLGV